MMWMVLTAVLIQVFVILQATSLHNDNSPRRGLIDASFFNSTTATATATATAASPPPPPPPTMRVFMGIISSSHSRMEMVYRNKHREIFQLWNDTRLCTLHDFELNPHSECRIIYSFVLGGGDNSTPTQLLEEDPSHPLVLTNIPILPRFQDINDKDMTVLNIQENMNEGKTPTFFYFGSQVARKHNTIGYVVKCDLDSTFRLDTLIKFVDQQLPTNGSPTVVGTLRHKAYWPVNRTNKQEEYWQQSYYAGMHLYLAGSLYMVSVDLVQAMVEEARKPKTNHAYFEGHEDHDATAMIELGGAAREYPALIRWIVMGKHKSRFWEHPVKFTKRWERVLKRERRKKEESLVNSSLSLEQPAHARPFPPPRKLRAKTLLVILGSTPESRKRHRNEYSSDPRACPLQESLQNQQCVLVYAFVVGGNANGSTELLEDDPTTPMLVENNELQDDVIVLNIR
jgi:hypothetical protein